MSNRTDTVLITSASTGVGIAAARAFLDRGSNLVLRTLAAAFALLLTAQAVNAQQVCTKRDTVVVQLEKQFDEQVAGRGLAANGKLMLELFVSEAGSWTVLVSQPDGRSCIIGSGEAWQGLERVVGDPA